MGRGAAGKSVLAARLGEITGLPVVELDRHFWSPGLVAISREQWAAAQRGLARPESWIMDGDLGPYDVPRVRRRSPLTRPTPTSACWTAPGRSGGSWPRPPATPMS